MENKNDKNEIGFETQIIKPKDDLQIDVKEILSKVYYALKEKGYNPVNQIVGYIMSGDPSYITSNNSARSIIVKVERDELLEELVSSYIEKNFSDNN